MFYNIESKIHSKSFLERAIHILKNEEESKNYFLDSNTLFSEINKENMDSKYFENPMIKNMIKLDGFFFKLITPKEKRFKMIKKRLEIYMNSFLEDYRELKNIKSNTSNFDEKTLNDKIKLKIKEEIDKTCTTIFIGPKIEKFSKKDIEYANTELIKENMFKFASKLEFFLFLSINMFLKNNFSKNEAKKILPNINYSIYKLHEYIEFLHPILERNEEQNAWKKMGFIAYLSFTLKKSTLLKPNTLNQLNQLNIIKTFFEKEKVMSEEMSFYFKSFLERAASNLPGEDDSYKKYFFANRSADGKDLRTLSQSIFDQALNELDGKPRTDLNLNHEKNFVVRTSSSEKSGDNVVISSKSTRLRGLSNFSTPKGKPNFAAGYTTPNDVSGTTDEIFFKAV